MARETGPVRRGFFVVVLTVIGIGIVAGILTSLLAARASDLPVLDPAYSQRGAIVIPFGLSRIAEDGSTLLDVCSSARLTQLAHPDPSHPAQPNLTLAEGSDGTCRTPDASNAPRAADRPAILSTTVVNDLVRCDQGRPSSAANFPAEQINASAELVGVSGIRFLVSANPSSPREVPAGAYCGELVTERAAGPYQVRNMVLLVSGRGGAALGMAALMVLIGALAGVFLRFLNDPGSKLISPYRRYRSVKLWVDRLPDGFDHHDRLVQRIEDVEDALWYLDPTAAETLIAELEEIRKAADASTRTEFVRKLPAAVAEKKPDPDPESKSRAAPRVALFSIFRYYWLIGLVVVVCFVVAGGVWTKYFQDNAFAGSDRDWFGLLVFGLAAQVTTSTVAEAFFNVKPTAASRD